MQRRNTRVLLAVGGMTAAVALLAALPSARADELSDLRANQALLQQRLNQLAAAHSAANPASLALAKGSFARSILIPGTDTSIRVGGHVELDMDWSLSGGSHSNGTNGLANNTIGENGILLGTPLNIGNKTFNGTPIASTSFGQGQMIERARSHGGTQWTPRQSRLRIETRTPTAWGTAGTVIEFDFAGGTTGGKQHVPDSIQPRLRLAYGTLGPWLAGQAYDNFSDNASHATTIDFGGNVGHLGMVRPPQIRYTWKFGSGGSLAVAAASPDTCVIGPTFHLCKDDTGTISGPGGASINPAKNSAMPDFSANLMWHQPWGHISIRGDVRDLHFSDGRYVSTNMAGGGGAISGSFKPGWFGWNRDVITWGFGYGDGIGRGFNGGDSFGLETNYTAARAAAGTVKVRTVETWGGHAGYGHWWTRNLQSTASFGIDHKDYSNLINSGAVASSNQYLTANKELVTTHLNLLYFPVSFVATGVEWVWGHRQTTANLKGDVNEIIGMVRVKF